MEVERIFSAEQIQVHPDLARIIREYTKAVIKNSPSDIVEFSYNYFRQKVEEAEEAAERKRLADDAAQGNEDA
jgi:hypothetical protein